MVDAFVVHVVVVHLRAPGRVCDAVLHELRHDLRDATHLRPQLLALAPELGREANGRKAALLEDFLVLAVAEHKRVRASERARIEVLDGLIEAIHRPVLAAVVPGAHDTHARFRERLDGLVLFGHLGLGLFPSGPMLVEFGLDLVLQIGRQLDAAAGTGQGAARRLERVHVDFAALLHDRELEVGLGHVALLVLGHRPGVFGHRLRDDLEHGVNVHVGRFPVPRLRRELREAHGAVAPERLRLDSLDRDARGNFRGPG